MLNRIRKTAEKYPDKIAYKVNGEGITYAELWERANHYANLLKRQGDSPVIIYGHKESYVVVIILACIISNRTYVPVDIGTPIFRLKKIIEMTGSTLMITNRKTELVGIDICEPEQLEKYRDREVFDCNSDIVYIIFTSGSTGEPKGVPISKTNLNNFVRWISHLKPLDSYTDAKVLNQASFSFDLSVADLYYSFCNGHTLIAFDGDFQNDFERLFSVFANENINIAVMTPTFMKLCLINNRFDHLNFPDFKCVYFCGERLESKMVRSIFDRFPDLQIINAYGPTEATSAISGILITKEMAENEQLLPVGDISDLATTAEISDDEIILKGSSVFNGYLGNHQGGYYWEGDVNCYKTGDIGFIRDGKLYCKGRKDSQIKYKGYRIELSDIENNLNRIPGVKEATVLAKYNDNNIVKTVKAFVIADKNVQVDYIKNELAKRIPCYMIPKTIKIMENFPVNQNGKIDRKVLSEL